MNHPPPETEMRDSAFHQLTADDFEGALRSKLSDRLRNKINQLDLSFENLSSTERDQCILQIVSALQNPDLLQAGRHRLPDWEAGWAENLNAIRTAKTLDSIVPRYFGKYDYARWKQEFIRPRTEGFDYKVLDILVEWALETWMTSVTTIYEFGCGPGYHLSRARSLYPDAKLVGLDWAKSSQQTLNALCEAGLVPNLEAQNFDFFKPNDELELPLNSGVFTVAALEQVDSEFEPFLQFLIAKKPKICVHLEPIEELLDPNHLVDALSRFYFRKRRYLHGFLTRLQELEASGIIQIHHQQRTNTGSQFIEGHSLVVWSPL